MHSTNWRYNDRWRSALTGTPKKKARQRKEIKTNTDNTTEVTIQDPRYRSQMAHFASESEDNKRQFQTPFGEIQIPESCRIADRFQADS